MKIMCALNAPFCAPGVARLDCANVPIDGRRGSIVPTRPNWLAVLSNSRLFIPGYLLDVCVCGFRSTTSALRWDAAEALGEAWASV